MCLSRADVMDIELYIGRDVTISQFTVQPDIHSKTSPFSDIQELRMLIHPRSSASSSPATSPNYHALTLCVGLDLI